MKRFKLLVLTFLLILSTLSPMTVHAEGNGNINNGGGGLGEGTDTNFWNTGDEGVRVTVVSASDGSAVSASIDLTNNRTILEYSLERSVKVSTGVEQY